MTVIIVFGGCHNNCLSNDIGPRPPPSHVTHISGTIRYSLDGNLVYLEIQRFFAWQE